MPWPVLFASGACFAARGGWLGGFVFTVCWRGVCCGWRCGLAPCFLAFLLLWFGWLERFGFFVGRLLQAAFRHCYIMDSHAQKIHTAPITVISEWKRLIADSFSDKLLDMIQFCTTLVAAHWNTSLWLPCSQHWGSRTHYGKMPVLFPESDVLSHTMDPNAPT